MKNKSFILIIIALAAVIITAALLYPKLSESYSPEQGEQPVVEENKIIKASDFIVYDIDGKEVKLSDYFGKPIVVNFWATWCGPCRSELPAFENAYKKFKDDVVFLMVNLTDGGRETKDSVKNFLENSDYSFPVYLDIKGYASDAYGIFSIPETIFINTDGSLHDTQLGVMSENALNNYIETMIKNK